MADVRETRLPGVGVRHEFTTDSGQQVGVLVLRDGRREILVYDRADPDACSTIIELSAADTRTMSELLGGSRVTEAVEETVQQSIEGLALEWIELGADVPSVGMTIGDGAYRTRTGASIVAIIRGDTTIPAPGPDVAFAPRDVVVAVGTSDGLATLREILRD